MPRPWLPLVRTLSRPNGIPCKVTKVRGRQAFVKPQAEAPTDIAKGDWFRGFVGSCRRDLRNDMAVDWDKYGPMVIESIERWHQFYETVGADATGGTQSRPLRGKD